MKKTFVLPASEVQKLIKDPEQHMCLMVYEPDYWYSLSYSTLAHSLVTLTIKPVNGKSRLARFRAAFVGAWRAWVRIMKVTQ